MRMRGLAIALAVWLGLLGVAIGADKVALLIGNSNYANVGQLANPANDSADLAASLKRIGFEVTLLNDLDQVGLLAALKAFSPRAAKAEMAVIYFGGHGIEVDQQNYIIPTDAVLASDRDVQLETIPLDYLTQAVGGAKSLRMVILDACRNNPFVAEMAHSNRSIGRGLNRIEPVGGTLVAYAAKAGSVASDGDGRNSPFMRGLLNHIEEPGLDVSLLFRKVRDSVLADTANEQEPFVYGSLPGDEIYLVPPVVVAASTPVTVTPAPVVTAPAKGSEQEEFAWGLVKDSADAAKLQQFLFAYPTGAHVPEAIALIKSLAATPAPGPVTVATAPEPEPKTPDLSGPELVRAVQTELRRLNCDPGSIDGQWGQRGRTALTRFKTDSGLATFALTDPTVEMLGVLRVQTDLRCKPAPAPTVETASTPKTPAAPSGTCAVIKVTATPRDPTGDVWDWKINGNPEPDIVITEANSGQSSRCDDSFTCSLRAAPVAGSVSLNIVDYDNVSRNQLIGAGQCQIGQTCQFSNSTVKVSAC